MGYGNLQRRPCWCTNLGCYIDVGMGVELGMARVLGKYNLVVIPDEDWGKAINLMTFGVADNFIKLSELEDYDFNKFQYDFYDGGVY